MQKEWRVENYLLKYKIVLWLIVLELQPKINRWQLATPSQLEEVQVQILLLIQCPNIILKSTPSKAILFSNDKMALLGVDFQYSTSKHLPYLIPNAL